MKDYDFKALDDKEFEVLCADLIGDVKGERFERFKRGKDRGVDGRYFAANGDEIILQCKHWANTPVEELIRRLKKDELKKLNSLQPKKYFLAVSNALSRTDKSAIREALSPYIESDDCIYGNEDLNDFLSTRASIERRHYKLWLSSSAVLSHIISKPIFDRSRFSVAEILRSARKYVPTSNHSTALEMLRSQHVVIVTGEPGVGKTTLAEHLCLHYVTDGFELIKIADEITEAESAFEAGSPQVFYFDDFLGRNYLEALSGHEGNHIVQFIKRIVADKSKRFVLTSRSTILNQGKLLIDTFRNQGIARNEFEIRLSSLTILDRARILYSHLWHSDLAEDYAEELYKEKRYRDVVNHKNFNPRIISFITDSQRIVDLAANDYWPYILQTLNNPADVWENPFVAQQDDFGRVIVLLVTLNRVAISQPDLASAYSRFLSYPESHAMNGRRDYLINLRHLTGSLLARHVSGKHKLPPTLSLFNPSLGDYVLRRYTGDFPTMRSAFRSLRTLSSVETLGALKENEMISVREMESVLQEILADAEREDYSEFDLEYLAAAVLCLVNECSHSEKNELLFANTLAFLADQEPETQFTYSASVLLLGIEKVGVANDKIVHFVVCACNQNPSIGELRLIMSLFRAADTSAPRNRSVQDIVRGAVVSYLCDNVYEEFDPGEIFQSIDYGDIGGGENELKSAIESWSEDMGIILSFDDLNDVIGAYDIEGQLHKLYRNSYEGERHRGFSAAHIGSDEVDDIFDRS